MKKEYRIAYKYDCNSWEYSGGTSVLASSFADAGQQAEALMAEWSKNVLGEYTVLAAVLVENSVNQE